VLVVHEPEATTEANRKWILYGVYLKPGKDEANYSSAEIARKMPCMKEWAEFKAQIEKL
jgi:hypothetical protein